MRYKLTTDDMLILRDGRPFGDSGMFGGNSLNWPFPQTIAGMVRTITGFSRDPLYFVSSKNRNYIDNINKILDIRIDKLLPMAKIDNRWIPLMPAPADLVLTRKSDNIESDDIESDDIKSDDIKLTVNPLIYKKLNHDTGTDIFNRQWLIPSVNLRDKPAKDIPFFFHWDFYDRYLQGDIKNQEPYLFKDIGITPPISEIRIHNAIDAKTFTTEESKLFSNAGFYLKSKNNNEIIDLAIFFDVINSDNNVSTEDISKDAWLGGERRRVILSSTDLQFPKYPNYFNKQSFLKIILTSHGDFGGWCPQWLQPDLDADSIKWVKIPNTDFNIRLRSSCVNGWDGVSGWDYKTQQPKTTKKLVRPGSVYLIEIKNLEESFEIAKIFWGGNIDIDNKVSVYNGYGQCIVGNAIIENNKGDKYQRR